MGGVYRGQTERTRGLEERKKGYQGDERGMVGLIFEILEYAIENMCLRYGSWDGWDDGGSEDGGLDRFGLRCLMMPDGKWGFSRARIVGEDAGRR